MLKRSKWSLMLLVLVLGVALIAAGCGGQGSDKAASQANGGKEIKLGLIAPMQGDVKTFGESAKKGFDLALEQAGYKAGDFTIKPVYADDRNDATEAVNVATKLFTQDNVKLVVGSITSLTTVPISELANANKVVMISPTGTSDKITFDNNKLKEYVFRACYIDPFQGQIAAKFASENLKAKTAAILYDQANDYTIGLANNFKSVFEASGGKVIDMQTYSKSDVDFSAVLTNIAKKNPDVLYLPDYYQKVSLIGKQAREKGIKAPFLGGDGWDSTDLDFATMEGSYFTHHYFSGDTRPEVQDWVAKFKAKYNNEVPDFAATLAYDATNLMLNAIKTAGTDDPDKVREAMANTKDFPAVTGKLNYDEKNNPIKSAVILQVNKDGSYKYVDTVNP